MAPSAARLAAAIGLCFLAAACRKEPAPPRDTPKPAPSSVPSAPAATQSAPRAPTPAPLGCRAMRVSGSVTLEGGGKLAPASLVDGSAWLELDDGSEVWLKHPPSGRELTLRGPARALVCRAGREEIVLASGKVTTGTGTGARPGAEVLIATPQGALRYGHAELDATSKDGKLALEVRGGEVWVEPADPKASVRTNPLRAKGKLSLRAKVGAEALIERCQKLAETAARSAENVLSAPPDAGSLGDRAAVQVRDRRAARAACSIARAATGQVADQAERQRLSGLLERWEALWQAVPRASNR